jgi:predicted TIM-barrel fold metal-dependent hydrolase
MNDPRRNTLREELAAQALEEIDALVVRVENCSETTGKNAAALEGAIEKLRAAVPDISAQFKTEVAQHLNRAKANSVEEQRAAMQEAARLAFRNEAAERFDAAIGRLERAASGVNAQANVQRTIVFAACLSSVPAVLALFGVAVLIFRHTQ